MTNRPQIVEKPWIARHLTSFLAAIAVLAYGVFIHWIWGWEKILLLWQEAGWGTALAAVALLLVTYGLRTWRIHDYFPQETAGQFRRLLRLVQVHNLLNIMLPFRSGEVSFPLLMRQEFGLSITRASAALLVMRLLDLHALLAAAGCGLVLEHRQPWLWGMWLMFALLPAVGFALRRPFLRLAAHKAPTKLKSLVAEVERGLPVDGRAFARAWGVTLVNWFVKVAVMAWVLMLLADINIAAAFGGGLGGELSSVLPVHAPGGVGTYPAGITAGALALGAPTGEAALSALGKAAVNAHLLIIVSSIVGTVLAMAVSSRKTGRA